MFMVRLIPIELIPASLWNKEDSILRLAPQLISSWEMLLHKYQLVEKARTETTERPTGGISQEATDDHLALRFTTSSARVMLAILDPLENLSEIPDVFARIFSGNKVFLADLPCGSGVATLSILAIFCELRKQGILPRMPLHVTIVGGEISSPARKYAKEALEHLSRELESQAIVIEFSITDWDVCNKISTIDLIQKLTLKSQDCSAKILLVTNFSDFLSKGNKWRDAQKQFDDIFLHSRNDNSAAIWIEPSMKNVICKDGFFSRIIKWFHKLFSSLMDTGREIEPKGYDTDTPVKVEHPLGKPNFRTNLAVVRFDLPSRRKV